MKKILSLVVLVAAAAMVSCAGNGNKECKGECDKCTECTEAPAEAPAEAVAPVEEAPAEAPAEAAAPAQAE